MRASCLLRTGASAVVPVSRSLEGSRADGVVPDPPPACPLGAGVTPPWPRAWDELRVAVIPGARKSDALRGRGVRSCTWPGVSGPAFSQGRGLFGHRRGPPALALRDRGGSLLIWAALHRRAHDQQPGAQRGGSTCRVPGRTVLHESPKSKRCLDLARSWASCRLAPASRALLTRCGIRCGAAVSALCDPRGPVSPRHLRLLSEKSPLRPRG